MAFLTKRSQNAQPFPKEMIRGIGELTNKQKAFVHTKALLAKIINIPSPESYRYIKGKRSIVDVRENHYNA